MRKKLLLVAVVAVNLLIAGITAYAIGTPPAYAQPLPPADLCEPSAYAIVQGQYTALAASGATGAVLETARAAFLAAIEACSGDPGDRSVRYDNGGVFAAEPGFSLDPRYLAYGTKWGGGNPFSAGSPPGIAGGTVTFSFMPNGVAMPGDITGSGNNVAITSLPGYQACFLTEIRNAFAAWTAVSNIQFVEVTDNGQPFNSGSAVGQIRIGAHIFDGPNGTLAHGYYPSPSGSGADAGGDLHFDVGESWSCTTSGGFDIGLVALHEVGHNIGLRHEPSLPAVMNAYYNSALTGLLTDDINGARAIYGTGGTPTGPANDLSANARNITLPTTYSQSTSGATVTSDPTTCFTPYNTVWFRYTHSGVPRNIEFNTSGSNFDTVLTVFSGAPGSLSYVGCNDDTTSTTASRVDFAAQTGVTYYMLVGGYSSGSFGTLNIQIRTSDNLMLNGALDQGLANWSPYATNTAGAVDMSRIVYRAQSGVMEFYRRPSSASAAMVQNTNAPVGNNQPLELSFQAGNSSGARKRIVIVLHDQDWSDTLVCAFFLAPNTALTTYTMRARTNEAWAGAAVDFYLSPANDLGWFRLDNMTLRATGSIAAGNTDCIDPNAPNAGSGSASGNYVMNPSFSSGSTSWGTFATPNTADIITNVTGGVMQFYRRQGSASGVVLQNTGVGVALRAPIQLTWKMGNSSPLRKRVLVILHDNDFSDSVVCSFWMAAGQGLTNYTMRAYTTETWSAANVAFYDNPAPGNPTDVNRQWSRVDDVSLTYQPTLNVDGTHCLKGAAALTAPDGTPLESIDPAPLEPGLTLPLDVKPDDATPVDGVPVEEPAALPTLIPVDDAPIDEGAPGEVPPIDALVPTLIPTATG